MSAGDRAETTRYARAVARAWSELPGAPGILSPRDWRLVEDWCARGVPLQVVREAIEAAAERLARGAKEPRRPRGLSYVAPAVEESWRVVLEGRVAEQARLREYDEIPAGAIDAWRARLAVEPEGSVLGRLLVDLIERLERGEPEAEIDRGLDEAIEASAAPGLLRRARDEVQAELVAYRGRMPASAFDATRNKALVTRLRAALGLPRLEQ